MNHRSAGQDLCACVCLHVCKGVSARVCVRARACLRGCVCVCVCVCVWQPWKKAAYSSLLDTHSTGIDFNGENLEPTQPLHPVRHTHTHTHTPKGIDTHTHTRMFLQWFRETGWMERKIMKRDSWWEKRKMAFLFTSGHTCQYLQCRPILN